MAVSAVPNYIDKDIFFKLKSIVYCHLYSLIHFLRLVSVHMNNWSLDRSGHISAIESASGLSRGSGEADLIVGDNVDGSVDVIVIQVGHLQAFIHDSLASYGCITMNNDSHASLVVFKSILDCSYVAHNYWIHCFQVRRIRHDR